MPADGIPRCHSPRTETSARPVSKSSSKKDYTIQRPSKRPHIGRGAAQTIRPKPVTPMSESGQSLPKCVVGDMSDLPPVATDERTWLDVSNVPIPEVPATFDHNAHRKMIRTKIAPGLGRR